MRGKRENDLFCESRGFHNNTDVVKTEAEFMEVQFVNFV